MPSKLKAIVPLPSFSFTHRAFTAIIPLLRSPVVLVGALTLPVGLMAILRGALTAKYFGAGSAVDALMVAQALALFLVNVAGGSLGAVSVPEVARARAVADPLAARQLIYTLLTMGAIKFSILALLVLLSAPLYVSTIGAHFDGVTSRLTSDLLYVFACFFFFSALIAQISALLNISGSYGWPALSNVLVPGVGCIALIAFHVDSDISALAWGLTAGAAIQCVLLLVVLINKVGAPAIRFSVARALFGRLGRQFCLLAGAAGLMAATQFVDLRMAAGLGPGNAATLGFGALIPTLAVTFITGAIAGPALSAFSQQLAAGDPSGAAERLHRYILLALALTIAPTALLIGLSRWLVDFLFVYHSADPGEATSIDHVQRLLALQIPFYAAGIIAVRMLTALQLNRLIMIGAAVNLGLKIVLNLVLVPQLGVAGVALSTSVVYIVSLCFCWFFAASALSRSTHRTIKK